MSVFIPLSFGFDSLLLPDFSGYSLGTYAVLWQIEHAKVLGLEFLYLGFWIKDYRKMSYKTQYQPIQGLVDGQWQKINVYPIRYNIFKFQITKNNFMSNNKPISLFYSYSRKDEGLRDQLETHLELLKRQQVISTWHDRKIGSGTEWKSAIDDNLEAADIILLLISADFIASDYCFDVETKRAMQRHNEQSAVVIPILLRPCNTDNVDFMELQGLPKNSKPVIKWECQDDAFTDIAKGIRLVAERIRNRPK